MSNVLGMTVKQLREDLSRVSMAQRKYRVVVDSCGADADAYVVTNVYDGYWQDGLVSPDPPGEAVLVLVVEP